MNCVVIDDEKLPRRILLELISGQPSLNNIKVFESSIDALKYINVTNEQIDLIFLDIMMPGFDGFDFLRALKKDLQIVIISSNQNFAIKAFEFDNIIYFLQKPIIKKKFDSAVRRAQRNLEIERMHISQAYSKQIRFKDNPNVIFVQSNNSLTRVELSSIQYIEARGNFILIKNVSGSQIVYSSLSKIYSKLPMESFFRVHRSYIINLHKIIDIKDNTVLIDKDVIPISRRNKSSLFRKLNLL